MEKGYLLIGRFGAPHGASGEVRLYSFTSAPGAIATYKPLLDKTGGREFELLGQRPVKENLFIVRIAGVSSRESAKALTNAGIYLPRAALPETSKEEFYLADLIGLAAVTNAGEELGRVAGVLNFGAGDILEIAPAGGGESLLLPFKKEIFPEIDLKARWILTVPPAVIEASPSGR